MAQQLQIAILELGRNQKHDIMHLHCQGTLGSALVGRRQQEGQVRQAGG